MGTYKIVPTSLVANDWTTVSGTPLLAVAGTTGGTTNIIKTALAAGNYRLRGGFASACFYLDGSSTPIAFASLPAGFIPTSARVVSSYDKNGDSSAIGYPQFDEITEGSADLNIFPYPSGVPSALLLYLRGLGVRGAGTLASSLLMGGSGPLGAALYIDGNYSLASSLWYYNPTPSPIGGHFAYSASAPGGGFVLATPTPGNPTPAISTVKRPTVYINGVGSVLVSPAVGCVGTALYIAGSGFGDGAQVTVGGLLADSIVVVDETLITCAVPIGVTGTVDVVVYNADGSLTTKSSAFTVSTPWWVRCATYTIDGIDRSYSIFVQQCTAPVDGNTWTQTTDPAVSGTGVCGDQGAGYLVTYGWYLSPSAFTGNVIVLATNPQPPRQWNQLSWATADAAMLGGFPGVACVSGNRLIYGGKTYTQGTDYPPIRIFDGLFDHELATLPPTVTDTVPKAVLAVLAANGTVYVSAHESGTSSSDYRGRVFSVDVTSGVVAPLGGQFAAGELPYALCWHQGRLWCGTNKTNGTAASVYYFRPGVDTAWTVDYTLTTSSVGGCTSLCSYGGKLYVGTDNIATARGKVLVRDSSGTYTTSDTGAGGTNAIVNNGYHAMAVFGSNLYASYWNNDTSAVTKIRKFDGSSWSTVYTGASTTLRPYVILFVDNGVLFAVGAAAAMTGALLSSADGTTWVDRTANIPGTGRDFQPAVGVVVV